jgi:hypothetical protein
MWRAQFFRILFLCLPAVGIAFTGAAAVSSVGAASLYYVSAAGCDSNDGRSPEDAWRSLTRIGRHPLQPGDVVLFRCGDTWRDQMDGMRYLQDDLQTWSSKASWRAAMRAAMKTKEYSISAAALVFAPSGWRSEVPYRSLQSTRMRNGFVKPPIMPGSATFKMSNFV